MPINEISGRGRPVAPSAADARTLAELNELIARADPAAEVSARAVLGEGPVGAPMALVGEQPGHQEDVQGRPFVGLAGRLLNRALAEAGIDRNRIYLTNAIKHFKFEAHCEGRPYKEPTTGEVRHYRWWLRRELELVRPRIVVALGATAVLAITGDPRPIGLFRGPAELDGHNGYITVHPSFLLRLVGPDERQRGFQAFVADLRTARALSGDAQGCSAS
jgi:DNA polymerase